MFGARPLLESACSVVAAGTASSPLELLQAVEISNTLDATVYSVPNIASLPSAACNKGRMVFVQDKDSYRYSDGVSWTNDFSTTQTIAPSVWSWGSGSCGVLGDGTTGLQTSSPVSVVGGFNDWSQVSAGYRHKVAIRQSGSMWSWGNNTNGALGDGTTTNRSSPVSVVGGFTDWCQMSAGSTRSFAIRRNGTLWAWGYNGGGRLGDGTVTNRSSPVSVVGGFTDWCQVSSGYTHTAAVRTNGTIWSWGWNNVGQLGVSGTSSRCSPVSVVGGFTDWCQVSAGTVHTVGLRRNGTLWAWGDNSRGQLGDNTTTNRSSPVSVVGGFTDWCFVNAGGFHSHAIRMSGTLWSWGCNDSGQLGTGDTVSRSSPVSVVGGFTDWCFVQSSQHGLTSAGGVRTNGELWMWGNNSSGQLGDSTTTNRSSPVSVVGGFTDWHNVSNGFAHAVGIRFGKGFPAL